ncbi:hypothetical protein D3C80_1683170 [compost metagenome]
MEALDFCSIGNLFAVHKAFHLGHTGKDQVKRPTVDLRQALYEILHLQYRAFSPARIHVLHFIEVQIPDPSKLQLPGNHSPPRNGILVGFGVQIPFVQNGVG